MKRLVFDAPHGRDCGTGLWKPSLLALPAAASLLVGAAIADDRPAGETTRPSEPAPRAAVAARATAAPLAIAPVEESPLTLRDAISLAERSRAAMQNVRDYTAAFTKNELIKGRMRKQAMEMKLRLQPFSVYLKYQSKREAGRQAIYVEGMHDGRLLVKEVGWKSRGGAMRLSLQNPFVTAENRYPVTHVGLANSTETVLTTWEREAKLEGVQAVVTLSADARWDEIACHELVVTHKNPRPEVDFHRTRICFDRQTLLPIHSERYGWPAEPGEEPPLIEEYSYSNVRTNVGLTDADFDPPQYGF